MPTTNSGTQLIQTWLFQIPCYFRFESISHGFVLESFTIGYFKLMLFPTMLRFPKKRKALQSSKIYLQLWLRLSCTLLAFQLDFFSNILLIMNAHFAALCVTKLEAAFN